MTVVGRGPDLASAHDQAEMAAGMISFDGLQRRRDIGLQALYGSGAFAVGSAR
jgi:phosphoribosylamine-glycine ligase